LTPRSIFVSVLALVALGGCASLRPAKVVASSVQDGCGLGEHSAQAFQLFFGRNIGKSPGVSEADFETFLETEISPRFPEGLSVIDTAGVWRGPDGVAVHELGKAVVIVLPGKADDAERVSAVTAAYKARFSQDSVLTARNQTCVSF
jgi:hypothetical protein